MSEWRKTFNPEDEIVWDDDVGDVMWSVEELLLLADCLLVASICYSYLISDC